jgi:hypothetical protein
MLHLQQKGKGFARRIQKAWGVTVMLERKKWKKHPQVLFSQSS